MKSAKRVKLNAMQADQKFVPLEKFVEINPESIGRNFPSENIEYIDISSVGSGRFIEKPSILNLKEAPSRAKRIVRKNDTILAMVRPNLRSFLFITKPKENTIVSTGFAVLRAKVNADARFIYYAVTNPSFTAYLSKNAKGTSYPAVDTNTIQRGIVPNIALPLQKKIATHLTLYDDVIENNLKRIQLLERAADLVYREWFMHRRFPKPDAESDVSSNVWDIHNLADLCVIGRGGSPRPIQNFMNGTIPWFKIGDATASQSAFVLETQEMVTEEGARKSVLMQPGELILSNSATCGIPYFAGAQGCIHDGWLYFKNYKRISQEFLFCCIANKRQELLNSVGDGSTQKNLNTTAVGNLKIDLPANDWLLKRFDDAVKPIFSQMLTLAKQNQKLAEARDLLLPRLMSGALELNAAESQVITASPSATAA